MFKLIELYFNNITDKATIDEVVFFLQTNLEILKKEKTLSKELLISILLVDKINKLCTESRITMLLETIKDYIFFTSFDSAPSKQRDNEICSFLRRNYLEQLSNAYFKQ